MQGSLSSDCIKERGSEGILRIFSIILIMNSSTIPIVQQSRNHPRWYVPDDDDRRCQVC